MYILKKINNLYVDFLKLTQGGEHTIQHTDDVLQNYTLDTYIILLTNVTLINLILKT